jgi:predicted amidohydrolase
MNKVRVALAQLAPKLGDPSANLPLHLDAIERSREREAQLVVFPELSLTGYQLLDQVPDVALSPGGEILVALARSSEKIDIVAGFAEEGPGHRFYNSAVYFSAGETLHVHRKLFLPTYGMFQEGRDFARGERLREFDAPFGRAGLLICEDLWHPPCAWLLGQAGVETILVLSSGPIRGAREGEITSIGVWRDLVRVAAKLQTSYVVYVNRVGCEDGLSFGGGSMVADPFGRIVVEAPALETSLVVADLEPEVLRRARTAYPLLRDADLELFHRELGRIRRMRYDLPDADDLPSTERPERKDPR